MPVFLPKKLVLVREISAITYDINVGMSTAIWTDDHCKVSYSCCTATDTKHPCRRSDLPGNKQWLLSLMVEWKSAGPLATATQSLPNLFTLFYVILTFPAHLLYVHPSALTQHASGSSCAHSHLPRHDPLEANSYRSPPGTTACALSNWLAWRLPAALLSVLPLRKRGHKNSGRPTSGPLRTNQRPPRSPLHHPKPASL